MWAIIRTANDTSVVVGVWDNYDDATEWAKAHSDAHVGCKIVPYYHHTCYPSVTPTPTTFNV